MDFIFPWQRHGSYASRIREGEKGAGAVSSGAGNARVLLTWFLAFLLAFLLACFHVGCLLETKNHMGCLLRWEEKSRLADFWRKRNVCGATSAVQVPTRGFLAKREVVWRYLSAIFHHSAKKEGGWRNLSKEKCRLADFRQKRKLCGATSRNSLFLCLPVQSKCSHGRGK